MAKGKIKIKIHDNTSIEEIEGMLDGLKNSNLKEFEFNDLKKIAEALGAEYLDSGASRGKGSQERFKSKELVGMAQYPIGNFGVHVFPAGKHQFMVRRTNFLDYLLPALKSIITIKRAKQNEKK